ncbi:AAA family ATPase [Amycolatopsis sp.]|jgi:predicted kinase|uniref:AAA family ATPase n=1 Tax=Amycolatopsis sp. TaxID=37632 RepID=UPI002E0D0ABD|nr:AAA family ATPase [Amycolatopsis sp.]
MTERTTIALGRRDLVVVAGLPGAGKTTMLRHAADGVPVLDSDQVRERLRAALPDALPYRCYRPLVHAWHRARILRQAVRDDGPMVVHEPATRASTRALLAAVGAMTRRPVRMVWLDATAAQALAGQRVRGRMIRGRSFARHVRRAGRIREALLADEPPPGWHSVQVLSREAADTTTFTEAASQRTR